MHTNVDTVPWFELIEHCPFIVNADGSVNVSTLSNTTYALVNVNTKSLFVFVILLDATIDRALVATMGADEDVSIVFYAIIYPNLVLIRKISVICCDGIYPIFSLLTTNVKLLSVRLHFEIVPSQILNIILDIESGE